MVNVVNATREKSMAVLKESDLLILSTCIGIIMILGRINTGARLVFIEPRDIRQ